MENANDNMQRNDVFSKRIRAGKRRTYFFDVRETRSNDYYLTITESKKKFNDDGYERHKIFVYKEDFNKFLSALEDVVDHIKTNLMPEYDFDEFTREAEDITNAEGSDYKAVDSVVETQNDAPSETSESLDSTESEDFSSKEDTFDDEPDTWE